LPIRGALVDRTGAIQLANSALHDDRAAGSTDAGVRSRGADCRPVSGETL